MKAKQKTATVEVETFWSNTTVLQWVKTRLAGHPELRVLQVQVNDTTAKRKEAP